MSEILHPLVYEDDTIQLYLETHPYYGCIVHMYSLKWSLSVAKHYYVVLANLLDALRQQGVEELYAMSNNAKLTKFSEMYGFQSTGTYIKDTKGTERLVMRCEL